MKSAGRAIFQSAHSLVFAAGCAVFLVAAVWGWIKLRYGIALGDEGMPLTDGWRMTVGDRMFPDNASAVVRMNVLFNQLVFELFPDATLLGFRKLQYVLTLAACGLFAYAFRRWSGTGWYLPFALSLFAFTGLDAQGMMSNLNYYTYPHLFLSLHLAMLLLGLRTERPFPRAAWLVGAGVMLWAVGFSSLPLVVTAAAPVLYWLAVRYAGSGAVRFGYPELACTLGPVVVLWAGMMAVFGGALPAAILELSGHFEEKPQRVLSGPLRAAAYPALGLAVLGVIAALSRLKTGTMLIAMTGFCVLLMGAIHTGGFGWVPAYRNVAFGPVAWFTGLLAVWLGVQTYRFLRLLRSRRPMREPEWLQGFCLIPSLLLGTVFVMVSGQGLLALATVSIPATTCLAAFLADRFSVRERGGPVVAAVALALVLGPYFSQVARADWLNTFSDAPPARLTAVVPSGFAEGIHTTPANADLIAWITRMGERYSEPQDTILAYNYMAMIHMLTHRRPALRESWVGLARSNSLRQAGIEYMFREKRFPALAFRHSYTLRGKGGAFWRDPLVAPSRGLMTPYRFPTDPDDPIDRYVLTRMQLVERHEVPGKGVIHLFVSKR